MKIRHTTNIILQLVEEGVLHPDLVIQACLTYMSEAQVADMAHDNELIPEYMQNEDDD